MRPNQILDEVYNNVASANYKLFHIWITHIIFTWRWWLGVSLAILPWIVWVKIRDKKDTVRLLFVGLIVMMITVTLDNIGISYHLWDYDWQVMPFTNLFIPYDFTLFPVAIMLILQFKPKINMYIKAVAFAFISAFIFEPLSVWMAMYDKQHWQYWYSFIIYIPLYLFFNYIYKSKLFGIHNNTIH